jgi:HEAT repeat protein
MRKLTFSLVAFLISANLNPLRAGAVEDRSTTQPPVGAIVEEMRGFSMQLGQLVRSDGRINTNEQRKVEITRKLRLTGKEAVPALVKALIDPDVQMRRNAALVLITLAGAFEEEQPRPEKMDIREAIPALVKATEDLDGAVRAWAAHALAEIGPDAKDAVPALIKLTHDSDEGARNDSCMALGSIGPAAKDALPALRNALKDPSKDVRQFAKGAIEKIEKK